MKDKNKKVAPMTRKQIYDVFEKMDRLSNGFVACGVSFEQLIKDLNKLMKDLNK